MKDNRTYAMYTNDKDVVVAARKYHGKVYRGVAKCNTAYDKFDIDYGTELAQRRCDYAVAKARVNYFRNEFKAILDAEDKLRHEKYKLASMYENALDEFVDAGVRLMGWN